MKISFVIWLSIFIVSFYGISLAQELEGTWIGQEDTGEPWTFIFTGDTMSAHDSDSSEWYNASFTNNTGNDPKELDMLIEECFVPSYIGDTSMAIYKIEGDVLTLTASEPGINYRPVSFGEGGNPRTYTVTLQDPDDDDGDGDGDGGGGGGGGGCFINTL